MALIDLKSNLASFRSDFSTPSVATQTGPKLGKPSVDDQLPGGSVFRYIKDGSATTKKFSVKGYNTSRQYSDNIQSVKDQPNKSLLYKRATEANSPSAIDEQYKKFSLRDESHNPTYMKQPFVVRGIQRKGNETPQYWGFGSRSGFDDGLIRGGVVTVADRVVSDTVRIAKFMASPKGLLWIVKQLGLGLTNPKVETIGAGPLARQTRIHTGVTSLLSVAGSPFGLHFTRHGLPFLNEASSYGNVQRLNKISFTLLPTSNRLIQLRSQLFKNILTATATRAGAPIPALSGLAGPNSVYGIGFTNHRRYTDTEAGTNTYTITSQYASKAGDASISTKINELIKPFGKTIIRKSGIIKKAGGVTQNGIFGNYRKTTPGNDQEADLSTSTTLENTYTDTPVDGINAYATLAYGKINTTDRSNRKGDFRNGLDDSAKAFSGKKKAADQDQYDKRNLETKYGFGNVGKIGADRSDPNKFLISSSKFNTKTNSKENRFVLISKPEFRGDKVTAIDIGSPGKEKQVYAENGQDLITFYFEDGVEGTNVMPFRCTMTGYSDSFTPGWDRIDIMGRPDGAYLYTTFERSVSFNFTVAALSRSEMIPMWRKLNYLSTYTMPDFNGSARPSGPFMRISIGSLFKNTPGFISSLTYTVPDDATWDIADDAKDNKDAKQLPMIVDVAMSFTVVGDFRPQMMGRAYSLQGKGDWLKDSVTKLGSKSK